MVVYLADRNPQPTLVKCEVCKNYYLKKYEDHRACCFKCGYDLAGKLLDPVFNSRWARLSRAIKGAIAFVIKPFAPNNERK